MTRDHAMDLMTQGAFQQEREAAGKWTRAPLGGVQLLSYFSRYAEHQALREGGEEALGQGLHATPVQRRGTWAWRTARALHTATDVRATDRVTGREPFCPFSARRS